jgi:hypothetical protein
MGATGGCTGPHLHFAILEQLFNSFVNPSKYVEYNIQIDRSNVWRDSAGNYHNY